MQVQIRKTIVSLFVTVTCFGSLSYRDEHNYTYIIILTLTWIGRRILFSAMGDNTTGVSAELGPC